MPKDYSKGKIYIIRSYQTDLVYIGSTVQTLSERMRDHRKKKNSTTSKDLVFNYDDCYIELIENYPCMSKDELETREGQVQREYIAKQLAVNKRIAGRSIKEWREDNKEHLKEMKHLDYLKNIDKYKERSHNYRIKNIDYCIEYDKQYREKNSDKLKEYKKQYREENKDYLNRKIECECGMLVFNSHLERHKESKRHLSAFNGDFQHCIYCNINIKKENYNRHLKTITHIENINLYYLKQMTFLEV